MKAIQISKYGSTDVLQLRDLPCPEPRNGQVRIRVRAAGVGPWDALVREGRSGIPQKLPLTPGSDVAGIVDAVGPEVTTLKVGDEVYGLTNDHFVGGYAEYCPASESTIAIKPPGLSFVQAASVPVVAVTAWQMLFEYAHAVAGQSVLIQGAAGNVGAYAVQMAHSAGLQVVGTASENDLDYVAGLGARTVIDYRHDHFEDIVPPIDIVLDLVGGEARVRSIGVLRKGGILVSVVSTPMPDEAAQKAQVRTAFFFVDVTTARLNTVTGLFERNNIVPRVGTVLPLVDARRAHEMLAGVPHARGKIVLNVADR